MKKIVLKIGKWLGFTALVILLLLVAVILIIRTEWAQNKIVSQATEYATEKTGTTIDIDHIYLTFKGNIQVEGLYVEDQQKDTLLYWQSLEAGLGFKSLLDNHIAISRIDLEGLRGNVYRDSAFNFDFILKAFASNDEVKEEENEAPMPTLSVGPISIRDCRLNYLDSVTGIDTKLQLGLLQLSVNKLDLNQNRFELYKIDLNETKLAFKQFRAPEPSEDSSSATLPFISFEKIKLDHIEISYNSIPDSLFTKGRIGSFEVGKSALDLTKNAVNVASIALQQSDIRVQLPEPKPKNNAETTDTSNFQWPEWMVKLNQLQLKNVRTELRQGHKLSTPRAFDSKHIVMNKIDLDIQNVNLNDSLVGLSLKQWSFTERSGFTLDKLYFDTEFTPRSFKVRNLDILTPHSNLQANLDLDYQHTDSLIKAPLNSQFAMNIMASELSALDAYYFVDSLRYDSLIQSTEMYPLQISCDISGKPSHLNIAQLKLNWLNATAFTLSGEAFDIMDSTLAKVNFPELSFKTAARDLGLLLNLENPTASLPSYVNVNGLLKGDINDLSTEFSINSSDGFVYLKAHAKQPFEHPSYQGLLKLDTLDMGKFSGESDLRPISLNLNFKGGGSDLETLVFESSIKFRQLVYSDYNYKGLKVKASIDKKDANLSMAIVNENLDFSLKATAVLDTINTLGELHFDLKGADLKDLNLYTQERKVAAKLDAYFKGNLDDFDGSLSLINAIVIDNDQAYRLDSMFVSLKNNPTTTNLYFNSEVINGALQSNTSVQSLIENIQSYQDLIINGDTSNTKVNDELEMSADFLITNSPILSEVLLPELKKMDSASIKVAFKPAEDILKLDLKIPQIQYADTEVDQLFIDLNATPSNTLVSLGFERLKSDPVDMHSTRVSAGLEDGNGNISISVLDAQSEDIFYSAFDVSKAGESTVVKVNLDKLVLNGQPWEIPSTNEIKIDPDIVRFSDFTLSRNEQKISLISYTDTREEVEKMKLAFDNFKLQAIFSLLNAGESPAGGRLEGNMVFHDLTGTPAIIANLDLSNLTIMSNKIGTLHLEANNLKPEQYDLDLSLIGPEIDLSIQGDCSTTKQTQALKMQMDLDHLGISLAEKFLPDQLKKASGIITGKAHIKGSLDDPEFEGRLGFENVSFTSVFLGTTFSLDDEEVKVNRSGLYFNNFTLKDTSQNNLVLNGKVGLENMLSPSFDLDLKANKFQMLNSSRENNDLLYGKALVNLNVQITGNSNLPKVKAEVELASGTEINYVVPATQAQIEERQGIVRFANMKDSSDIISTDESSVQTITGYDITAYLKIDPKTTFNIIIDEQSGDQLSMTGQANLSYTLNPNGNMNLSGNYEMSDGGYSLNLYELVKKNFDIAPGSHIVWSGDPMGAELDITAIYKVETAASDLMAYKMAEADASVSSKYKQKLPFEVKLYIKGSVEEPEISFGLDMPDASKDALGGSVYRQVQQISEDESELNKQVFALIVFDRFLPSEASSGGVGASELARSSVSKLLSSQLNKLSEKYIEGFELNFDLNSYSNYQTGSAEAQTDLNVSLKKSLFSDRVVVKAGSSVGIEGEETNNEIIGDISAEYLITEDGQYRLKAFRKNQFQDVVEGQVTITGLSILFNKEFDTFSELLKKEDGKEKSE